MRPALLFIVILLLLPAARAEDTLQERYLAVYLKINEAEHLEARNNFADAAQSFRDCYAMLMKIHDSDPTWESALVLHRLDDFKAKILDLNSKAPAEAGPNPVGQMFVFAGSNGYPSYQTAKNSYPWKERIKTTIFYIGEDSSHASAWNENWTKSDGGSDDPDDRNGFATASHASSVNPFYVALPFNDLAHPDKARDWVPRSWHRPNLDGKQVSACKDRWVCVKSASGRSCYAQWEDVGPNGSDHAEYVFGTDRPDGAGLDVSPAVAQYLGLNNDAKAVTSWRFVDDQDVPPGQWLKYDEQAVIYTALHQIQMPGH